MGTTTVRTLEYAARNVRSNWGENPAQQNPINGARHNNSGIVIPSEAKTRSVGAQSRDLRLRPGEESSSRITAQSGEADIFIYPGFQFKVVGAMLTNFHLPKSTLLMLVSAFAGRERVLHAYEHAVGERYRFYSYGDCMFVE